MFKFKIKSSVYYEFNLPFHSGVTIRIIIRKDREKIYTRFGLRTRCLSVWPLYFFCRYTPIILVGGLFVWQRRKQSVLFTINYKIVQVKCMLIYEIMNSKSQLFIYHKKKTYTNHKYDLYNYFTISIIL